MSAAHQNKVMVDIRESEPPFKLNPENKGALEKLAWANKTGLGEVRKDNSGITSSASKTKKLRIASRKKTNVSKNNN